MDYIIVYKVTRGACGHPFFEGDLCLANCPHCGSDVDVVSCEESMVYEATINPLTGEVALQLKSQQEGEESYGASD